MVAVFCVGCCGGGQLVVRVCVGGEAEEPVVEGGVGGREGRCVRVPYAGE